MVREAPLFHGGVLSARAEHRDAVWLVRSGAFKIVRYGLEGVETVLDFRLPGDLLTAVTGQVEGEPMAIALTESSVCRLMPPGDAATDEATRYWRCLSKLALAALGRSLRSYSTLPAMERVAQFLQDIAGRLSQSSANGAFDLPMSRAEIGSLLGLTEETVSRALQSLQVAGRLRVSRRRVELLSGPEDQLG